MKLKNLFPLLALMLGAFTFTACGDDDEPTPQDKGQGSEANKEVVGTYEGWTHLTTAYISRNYANDTFVLTLNDDGTLVGTFTDAVWGVATITGIQASKIEAGEGYKLENGEGTFVMNNPRDPENPTQDITCKLENGTLSSDKTQMTVVISAYMEVGHGDMTFTFQTGEMPSDN